MAEKFDWGEHSLEPIFLAGWDTRPDNEAAQEYCSLIARSHYENFIISNKFTPSEIRQHIENVYAFCRYGDDLGDEAPFPEEGRLALLEAWESDLAEAAKNDWSCLLYTSPSPRDKRQSRMPSSA